MRQVDRVAFLVLGIHRLGTSPVMEMLGKLGVYLGPADELLDSVSFDARGRFEYLDALSSETPPRFFWGGVLTLAEFGE